MLSTLGATHFRRQSVSPEIRQHCWMRGIAAIELSKASSTGWAELDRDERYHLIAEQPLVDDGADRPDHAAAEQGLQPPQAVGRGDPDAQRQLVVADPPVLLQLG